MHVHYYTTADHENLARIYEAGQLEPGLGESGLPALIWFSSAPKWDPLAAGTFFCDGRWQLLAGSEAAARFGCARFSLPVDDPRLLSWEQGCRHAQLSFTKRRKLEQAARRMGLSPSGWRVAAVGIPLESLQFSVFGRNGWEPLPFRHDLTEDELRRLSDFEV